MNRILTCWLLLLFVGMGSLFAQDDAQEPNDTSAAAKDITVALNAGGGVLNMPGLVILSANDDWFKFTITERSSIDLLFLFVDGSGLFDLDVYLYNSSMTIIGKGETGAPNEHIVNSDLAIGTYFIKITGWGGASNNYEMQIKRNPYVAFKLPEMLAIELPNAGQTSILGEVEPMLTLLSQPQVVGYQVTSSPGVGFAFPIGGTMVTWTVWSGVPDASTVLRQETGLVWVFQKGQTPIGVTGPVDGKDYSRALGGSNGGNIGRDSSGGIHIAWFDGELGRPYRVWYRRGLQNADSGEITWTDPVDLSDGLAGYKSFVSISVSDNAVHCTWAAANNNVMYRRIIRAGNVWNMDASQNTGLKGSNHDNGPDIAAFSDDEVHIVSIGTTSTSFEYGYRLTGTTSWVKQTVARPVGSIAFKYPAITVDHRGHVHLAFTAIFKSAPWPTTVNATTSHYWNVWYMHRPRPTIALPGTWVESHNALSLSPDWQDHSLLGLPPQDVAGDWIDIQSDPVGNIYISWHGTIYSHWAGKDDAFITRRTFANDGSAFSWEEPQALHLASQGPNGLSYSWSPSICADKDNVVFPVYFYKSLGLGDILDANGNIILDGYENYADMDSAYRVMHNGVFIDGGSKQLSNSAALNMSTAFPGTTPHLYRHSNGKAWLDIFQAMMPTGSTGLSYLVYQHEEVTKYLAPYIITQPANLTVDADQTASFSVSVNGMEPMTFIQWYKDDQPLLGASATDYTKPPVTADDNGAMFHVVVTNDIGSVQSAKATLTVNKLAQIISFVAIPNKLTTDAPFNLIATSSSNLTVSFSIVSGAASVVGNTVTIADVGAVVVRASQTGSNIYLPAVSVDTEFIVNLPPVKLPQSITFASISDKLVSDVPFTLSATSSSNLVVNYSIVSGPATISGNTITTSGAGLVTVRADQAGDATYLAAASVDNMFTVNKIAQSISFSLISDKIATDAPFNVSATSSSNLVVSYSIVSGPATISGNTISLTGAGIVTVRADQVGDDSYLSATSVDGSFAVTKATQTLSFPVITSKLAGIAPFALNAVASSGLVVNYSIVSGPATISGDIITLTGAGSVTVRASQIGDEKYFAATSVNNTFAVTKSTQIISFTTIPSKFVNSVPFDAIATASSGLPITFSIVSGPATIIGNTITITAAGTVKVRAAQVGSALYSAATNVDKSFVVSKLTQTITFPAIATKLLNAVPFVVSATTTSGLPLTYSIISGPATIVGDVVTLTGVSGSIVVRATQVGDATYASKYYDRSITVSKLTQTITFPAIATKLLNAVPFVVSATTTSGLPLTYSIISGPATIAGDVVTLTGISGSVVVRATQVGDATYASKYYDRSITVNKLPQVITIPTISTKVFGGAAFVVTASSNAGVGYPVTLSYVSGPALVTPIAGSNDILITIIGAGTIVIKGTQAGDATYASTTLSRSITVSKATSTTTLVSSANPSVAGSTVTLTAKVASTASIPTGTVTFTVAGVVSAPVAVDASGFATFDIASPAPLSVSVKATYSGSGNFNTSYSATITQK